jgi:hypothetical protein
MYKKQIELFQCVSGSHRKGIVEQILRGIETRLIWSVLVNWRPANFYFWILKTPSQEELKIIFSGLNINVMALSDQIDFPAFFISVRWLTTIRCSLCTVRHITPLSFRKWLSGIERLQKINVIVTTRKANCWKERCSVTLSRQSQLISLKLLTMVLYFSCDGVPLK